MENFEIIPGIYNDIKEVKVKFIKTIEVEESPYSENEVIDTITVLEQQKINFCAIKDAEIEVNNQMLAKIRAIDRTNNIAE